MNALSAIWDWIHKIMKQGMEEHTRFALCYTFLFPLIEDPQYEIDMKYVLSLNNDTLTRLYLEEAYSHLEDERALERDLAIYRP